jgi:hypothetical protein
MKLVHKIENLILHDTSGQIKTLFWMPGMKIKLAIIVCEIQFNLKKFFCFKIQDDYYCKYQEI